MGDARAASLKHDLIIGFGIGATIMALLLLLLAATPSRRDPAVVLGAMTDRGVVLQPRIKRLPPDVRTSLTCAALAVFMEARGETPDGQLAVAWVVRTREETRWQSTCAVVFERSQFEWTSRAVPHIAAAVARDEASWQRAQDAAWAVWMEDARDPSMGADHFWSGPTPHWARRTPNALRVKIGGHTFIRLGPRTPRRDRIFAPTYPTAGGPTIR